jgi:hypothetical protein
MRGDFLLSFWSGMIQNHGHADPSGTSLALPDRLAGNQQHRALHTSGRTLRALSTPSRSICYLPSRHGWRLVGRRDPWLARRTWTAAPLRTQCSAARSDPHDTQARLPGDRASQSRSDLQRAALAQPRSTLSAVPHDPRRARASAPTLVERLSRAGDRRLVFRPLQLENATSATTRCLAAVAALEGRMPAALWSNSAGSAHDRIPSQSQDDRDGETAAGR